MDHTDNQNAADRQQTTAARIRKLNKWFDAATWIDSDNIKRSCSSLESMFTALKRLILGRNALDSSVRFESFEQMMQQLELDERAIDERIRWMGRNSLIYFLMTCLTLVYVVYLWTNGGWLLGMLSVSFVAFLAAMTCRERMHYYQLKNRLVSCTLGHWWHDFCQGRG